jgi:hypothetical protein
LILHFFVFEGPPDLFSTQAAENLAMKTRASYSADEALKLVDDWTPDKAITPSTAENLEKTSGRKEAQAILLNKNGAS